MDQMVACPDCGTPNRASADLCVQCWRALSEGDLVSKIPAAAFAVSAPARVAPPPPAVPRQPVPAPVTPREAEPGPVPYFAPVTNGNAQTNGWTPPVDTSPVATGSKAPWGALTALALVLAVLGGGYWFFFGRSSSAFSPEDGSYSVVLPDGWERMEAIEDLLPPQIDAVVQNETEQSALFVGHWPVPPGATAEHFRVGLNYARQFMPQFPGVTMGSFEESNILTGEGVTAFEMRATVNGGLLPQARGKLHVVLALRDGAPSFVLMMGACVDAECAASDPVFQEMAKTFEFSE